MDMDKKIVYTFPEGFQEAAQVLDFLPEEQREQFLMFLVGMAQMF